jgi:hypothetical protein
MNTSEVGKEGILRDGFPRSRPQPFDTFESGQVLGQSQAPSHLARLLDHQAFGPEQGGDFFAMVTLHLYSAVLDGAA